MRLLAFALAVLVPLTLAGGAAAQPANDDIEDTEVLAGPPWFDAIATTGATVQAGEPLTGAGSTDPFKYCNTSGFPDTTTGVAMGATAWYAIEVGGGQVTVDTEFSDFDTVLGIYAFDGNAAFVFRCDDDSGTTPENSSVVTFNSANPGSTILIQVGGFLGATGNLSLFADEGPPTGPPNDDRAAAQLLEPNVGYDIGNFDATAEVGEDLVCEPANEAPFSKTVWLRFVAPANGKVTFSATGFDTVASVYEQGAGQPLACVDDGPGGSLGAALENVSVVGGRTYHVQVGGYGFGPLANEGTFTYRAAFSPDPIVTPPASDDDQDGIPNDRDQCDDENVRLGTDRDQNGCLDFAKLNPRAKLSAGSYFRVAGGRNILLGVLFKRLTIKNARGTKATLTCTRRACRRQTKRANRRGAVTFKKVRRKLRAGTRLRVRLTRRRTITHLITIKIQRNDWDITEKCSRPPSGRPTACSRVDTRR